MLWIRGYKFAFHKQAATPPPKTPARAPPKKTKIRKIYKLKMIIHLDKRCDDK